MADWFGDEFDGLKKKMKWGLKDMKHFDSKTESPPMNVVHSPDQVIVKFKMPGISKKDIHLKIGEKSLEVMAEKRSSLEVRKKGMLKQQKSYGRYYRRVSLPAPVNHKSARVDFSKGVLRIALLKK